MARHTVGQVAMTDQPMTIQSHFALFTELDTIAHQMLTTRRGFVSKYAPLTKYYRRFVSKNAPLTGRDPEVRRRDEDRRI